MNGRWTITIGRVAFIACLFLLWEAAAGGLGLGEGFVDDRFISPPSLIAADIVDYASSGQLATDLGSTGTAALLGLLLGLAGGVAFGFLLGYFRTAAAIAEPVIIGLNSLPRITVAPLLVLWFGLGLPSKVAVSLFTVFFVIFWNTLQGVRNIDVDLVRVVKVMGGGSGDVVRLVVVPSVFSWIFAALRTSVSFALTGAVVGEFVGSTQGLGYRMRLAVGLLDTDRVFAITVILMLLGTALVLIASRVEAHLLRWRGRAPALS